MQTLPFRARSADPSSGFARLPAQSRFLAQSRFPAHARFFAFARLLALTLMLAGIASACGDDASDDASATESAAASASASDQPPSTAGASATSTGATDTRTHATSTAGTSPFPGSGNDTSRGTSVSPGTTQGPGATASPGATESSSWTAPPLPPPGTIRACFEDPACEDIFVVAHRGLVRPGVPENSLAAIRAAAEAGIPMAEIDIRTSADGVLVLMHDTTVNRTTDGEGATSELTWAELETLTLSGGDPEDPESTRVARMEEVFALAAELEIALYLDIKVAEAEALVPLVQAAGMEDQSLYRRGVGSLVPIRALDPDAWVLAPVGTLEDAEAAAELLDPLVMVELTSNSPQPEIVADLIGAGFVVQQDVFLMGDTQFRLTGNPRGWNQHLDSGVRLLQTDLPEELQLEVDRWLRSR